MAHHNTVFSQLLKLLPRHEFESLSKEHHSGQQLRRASRWAQFVALGMAQLSGRQSLRDIVANLSAQANKLYHLGCRRVARTTLARVNEHQPYTLYEALFGKLYARCQALTPKHPFRFKNKLYSLDTSLIDLSLAIFPWADYNREKAAAKLHVGLDHAGYLPAFATITHAKVSDIAVGRTLRFPKGSMVVFDKGYTDYCWYKQLTDKNIFFVTRQRKNADYTVLERRTVNKRQGLTCDQTIRLRGKLPQAIGVAPLRRIGYRDPESTKHYVFLTNISHLSAKTIADLYKARWQIELFFKWIKQNLKIKSFLGTSRNAMLTQIWVALCMYLLLAYLKHLGQIPLSLQQILRLLQLNLFERRDLAALLKPEPPDPDPHERYQLCLV